VQVQDGVTVESGVLCVIHQQLNRSFVVQDHLRLQRVFAFGGFAQCQQAFGLKKRVRVAFQTAGVPGQIDQQTIENLPGVGAGRTLASLRARCLRQALLQGGRKARCFVGPIAV
jgi:hypothetical protein